MANSVSELKISAAGRAIFRGFGPIYSKPRTSRKRRHGNEIVFADRDHGFIR